MLQCIAGKVANKATAGVQEILKAPVGGNQIKNLFVELLTAIVKNLYPQLYNYEHGGETNMLFHSWLVSRETNWCTGDWSLYEDYKHSIDVGMESFQSYAHR